jgi:hypothetical protein
VRNAAVLVALLVMTSCASSIARRGAPTVTPEGTAAVGDGLLTRIPSPSPSQPVTHPGAKPLFVLTVRDQNGNRVRDIPVRFTGPVNRVMLTDAKGVVELFDHPGDYQMSVDKGCYTTLQITGGVFGTIHLYAGLTKTASLKVVWRHRFAPSAPATTDAGGDWTVGKVVRVSFGVQDRCKDSLAPRASYPTFVFQPGRNLALAGTPSTVADARGDGTVAVKCTAPGDAQLVVRDLLNPPDRVDLVAAAIGYAGAPRCVKQ